MQKIAIVSVQEGGNSSELSVESTLALHAAISRLKHSRVDFIYVYLGMADKSKRKALWENVERFLFSLRKALQNHIILEAWEFDEEESEVFVAEKAFINFARTVSRKQITVYISGANSQELEERIILAADQLALKEESVPNIFAVTKW